jgi:hypothetical protein
MAFVTPQPGTAGQVYTAAAHNVIVDDLNFLYQPPMCRVYRSTDLTGYTSDAAITWSAEDWDTDGMFSSGTTVTIQTTGLYLLVFAGRAGGNATVTRILPRIKSGGSTIGEADAVVQAGVTGGFAVSCIRKLTASTQLTCAVLFGGGSNYFIDGASPPSNEETSLAVMWLGNA